MRLAYSADLGVFQPPPSLVRNPLQAYMRSFIRSTNFVGAMGGAASEPRADPPG